MRRASSYILAVGLLAALVGLSFGLYLRAYLHQPLSVEQPIEYQVNKGSSLSAVAQDLARLGLLTHPRLLARYARIAGRAQLLVGEYALEPGVTPSILLDKFNKGSVIQRRLTLIEGWTFSEALRHIHSADKIQRRIYLQQAAPLGVEDPVSDVERLKVLLGLPNTSLEGSIFPDTYQYYAGMSDLELLQIAAQSMRQQLQQQWLQRDLSSPYESPYQALIMASIIEKETGVVREQGEIAGVFVRRLDKGMRLQTDPTVIYSLGADYNGNLTRADLRYDSPYNTYRYAGLPPGPIALPGLSAITAALNPKLGSSLYFVAKGDGSHQFSDTLAQHNAAVRQYQIINRRKDYRSVQVPIKEGLSEQQ